MNRIQKVILVLLSLIVIGEVVIFFATRQTQDISASKEETTNYVSITSIDFTKYKELINKSEKSIIVLVQTTCGYCNEYKPILNEVSKEYTIPIYMLDVMNLSDTEIGSLQSSLTYFAENPKWGTPLTLIVENKKVVDALPGFVSKLQTIQFYQKNGLIQ